MSLTSSLTPTEQTLLGSLCDKRIQSLLTLGDLTAGEREESRLLSELSLKLATQLPIDQVADPMPVPYEPPNTVTGVVNAILAKLDGLKCIADSTAYIDSDGATVTFCSLDGEHLFEIEIEDDSGLLVTVAETAMPLVAFLNYMNEAMIEDIQEDFG